MTSRGGSAAAVVGVAETEYVRGTTATHGELAIRAALAACEDAGVDPCDVDGLVLPGFRGKGEDVAVGLRMKDWRWSSRSELGGAGAVAALGHAAAAVETGRARHVVVSACRLGYSGARVGAGGSDLLADLASVFPSPWKRTELEHPYGVIVPGHYYAWHAARWLHEYAIDPDAMGLVALAMREHAQLNPRAYMRGRPLSMDAYLDSPHVIGPLRLLDCCLETDGAAAVLISAANAVTPGRHDPVGIVAVEEGHPQSPDDIVGRDDTMELGIAAASRRAFERTGLGPWDMDFAQIYDCFTFVVMRQLEEMGFCARGESPRLLRERGISLNGGALPVNTHGGLMSQAHVIGMNHVVEAVRQLRHEAGAAQVDGCTIGLVTGYGDFGDGAIAILRREAA